MICVLGHDLQNLAGRSSDNNKYFFKYVNDFTD